jgi:hypothetical protein
LPAAYIDIFYITYIWFVVFPVGCVSVMHLFFRYYMLISSVRALFFRLLPDEKSPTPLLDSSAFEAPGSADSENSPLTSFNQFCLWLLNTVDEVCLPLVSVSFHFC